MTPGTRLATYTLEIAPELVAHLEVFLFAADPSVGYRADWELAGISLWYDGALLDTDASDWLVRQLREQAEACVLEGFDEWLVEQMRKHRKGAA
jgi:hypothetical protein